MYTVCLQFLCQLFNYSVSTDFAVTKVAITRELFTLRKRGQKPTALHLSEQIEHTHGQTQTIIFPYAAACYHKVKPPIHYNFSHIQPPPPRKPVNIPREPVAVVSEPPREEPKYEEEQEFSADQGYEEQPKEVYDDQPQEDDGDQPLEDDGYDQQPQESYDDQTAAYDEQPEDVYDEQPPEDAYNEQPQEGYEEQPEVRKHIIFVSAVRAFQCMSCTCRMVVGNLLKLCMTMKQVCQYMYLCMHNVSSIVFHPISW